MRYKDKRSGKLTLIERSRSGGRGIGEIWWAVCDCGNRLEVQARRVASGKRKSCGMCGKGLGIHLTEKAGLPPGMRYHWHYLLKSRKPQADLDYWTPARAAELRIKRCIICNEQGKCMPEWNDDGTGLVPVCPRCTRARGKGKLSELLEWVMRVARRVQERLDT